MDGEEYYADYLDFVMRVRCSNTLLVDGSFSSEYNWIVDDEHFQKFFCDRCGCLDEVKCFEKAINHDCLMFAMLYEICYFSVFN